MHYQHTSDDNGWRLRRITQLWDELSTAKFKSQQYHDLMARIRCESEEFNKVAAAEHQPRDKRARAR